MQKKEARCRRTCFVFQRCPLSWCLLLSLASGLSIRVNILVFKPSQIIPSATADCRVWLETVGLNMSVFTVSVRHSWMWSCCGKRNLYREQALEQAQIELFTWLATLCCGITWKCMDTQRELRAQTLKVRRFCDYRPGTLTYKCSHIWNSPFYSSRILKWNWMGVFTSLVTLPSFILKIVHGHRQAFRHRKEQQGFSCDNGMEIYKSRYWRNQNLSCRHKAELYMGISQECSF